MNRIAHRLPDEANVPRRADNIVPFLISPGWLSGESRSELRIFQTFARRVSHGRLDFLLCDSPQDAGQRGWVQH